MCSSPCVSSAGARASLLRCLRLSFAVWCGCAQPQLGPSAPALPISVRGRVEPAFEGVMVTLAGTYTNTTTTDATGAYAFEGVPSGRYTVRVSLNDYTREPEIASTIEGEAGATVEVPTLVFTPAGAVAGRVTLGGQPSGNAGVAVSLDGTDLVTTTTDSGAFYLPRVAVGDYRLRAEKAGFGGRTRRGVQVEFARVTQVDTLNVDQGVAADFNHAPALGTLQLRPYQSQLPLDLTSDQVARHDLVTLVAKADDPDGDRLTYFWSVTAGSLDRTDVDTVQWLMNDKKQASATITVRVVDERGAAAYASTTVSVVDTQALSGVLQGNARAVYAYRLFGGAWRVLDCNLATGTVTRVGEIASLDDPQANVVGAFYHVSAYTNGFRRHWFWRQGEDPQERSPAGEGRGLVRGDKLILASPPNIVAYDPQGDSTSQLFTCGAEPCGDPVASTDAAVVSLQRSNGASAVAYLFDSVPTRIAVAGPVGERVRTDGASFVFADVFPGGGRSSTNAVVRQLKNGAASEIYAGAYDVFVGAFDGRFVSYTEQAYRAVYSYERAFVRDTQTNRTYPVDTSEWPQDETFAFREGHLLYRRYPRADWLQASDRTHYQLARMVVPQ